MGRPRKTGTGIASVTSTGVENNNPNASDGIFVESKPDGNSGVEIPAIGESTIIEGIETADPGTAETGSTEAPKRRGRPKGSRNASTKATSNLAGLETILLSLHTLGAALFSCPELKWEENEAKEVTKAIANVAQHYPQLEMAPKLVAWINLCLILGAVEGTRILAIGNRLKKERMARPHPQLLSMSNAARMKPNGVATAIAQEPTAKQERVFSPSQFNSKPPLDNE